MTSKKSAAAQFAALGIPESDWTETMRLAVKQKWSSLPVDQPVAKLRADLAAVPHPFVPSPDALQEAAVAAGEPALSDEAAAAEHKRLKRNASVTVWRTRNQIQAALDARELKFAGMRAKRGAKTSSSAEPQAHAS